jgi:hypothetical protein
MELHGVDAPAPAVVRGQLRRVHVGQPRMGLHRRAAQRRAELRELCRVEPGGVEEQRIAQRPVGAVQVDVGERRGLVEDLVRGCHACRLRVARVQPG